MLKLFDKSLKITFASPSKSTGYKEKEEKKTKEKEKKRKEIAKRFVLKYTIFIFKFIVKEAFEPLL